MDCRKTLTTPPTAIYRVGSAALLGTLLWSAQPAAATEHYINCGRPVSDQYATMVFDVHYLDIPPSEREVDGRLELRAHTHVVIRQIDPARPGWVGAVLCEGQTDWAHDEINLNILNQGAMRYPIRHPVLVRNVPRLSVVELTMVLSEDDSGGGSGSNDIGDLSPVDGEVALRLTLWPNDGTGQTRQVSGNVRDLTFGQRKRVVGSGSSFIEDFRAAVEFTVSMSTYQGAAPGVSGAVGGTPPPQVGGAIHTDERDPGLTGPGQAIGSREDRCRAYAISAIQQDQAQRQMHCGYAPPVWNSDPNAHYNWCMQSNHDTQTQAGWLLREAGLATCRQNNP